MSVSATIRPAFADDFDALAAIWLRNVRVTHRFLTEADIQEMLPQVREQVLPALELWAACDETGRPVGFMGLAESKLEALFLDPSVLRRGIGRALVEHARQLKGPLTVDVNEQNPEALRFYEACGFVVVGRSETDADGRPFPLLHLVERTA